MKRDGELLYFSFFLWQENEEKKLMFDGIVLIKLHSFNASQPSAATSSALPAVLRTYTYLSIIRRIFKFHIFLSLSLSSFTS